jgi:hypothetical protein
LGTDISTHPVDTVNDGETTGVTTLVKIDPKERESRLIYLRILCNPTYIVMENGHVS